MKKFLENKKLWPLNDIFKSLVERAKISITYYSPITGEILLINKTAARAVDSSPEDLEGKTIYNIYPQFADNIRERTEEIIANKKEITTKDFIKPTTETGFWFESSYAPIYTKEDKLYAIQITANDISSRIESEKDMEVMQQNLFDQYMREKTLKELLRIQTTNIPLIDKLNNALNLLFGVHWLEHALKGCFFVIQEKNILKKAAYINVAGYTEEELGICCDGFKLGEGFCGKAAQEGKEFNEEDLEGNCKMITLPGAILSKKHIIPILYEEDIEGIFSINVKQDHPLRNQDLAFLRSAASIVGIMIRSEKDQVKIEQQRTNLISSSKLASLGEMASGVAHEINNPLTIINGYSKILLNAAKRQDENIQELMLQLLPQIDLTVGRISRIVIGLQNFSRDGSNDEKSIKPFKEVIDKTLTFCQEKFSHRSIEVKIEIESDDIKINCSETQLSQVFLNLINNSYSEIKDNEEKWIKISCVKKEDHILISFIDSGKGIPKEVAEKIMQPFFTTKDPKDGTGLGLSISSTIIENHGGVLRYNEDNPNTCFEITLPLPKND